MDAGDFFSVDWRNGQARPRGCPHLRRGHTVACRSGDGDDSLVAEWTWRGDTFTASSDTYGLHPIYYLHDGSRFAIATNPLDIFAAGFSSPIDYPSLGTLMRMCNFFGGDTPWARIKAIPPNSVLTANASGVRITGGPRLAPTPMTCITRDQAIDGFIDRVRDAVRRRLPCSDRWVHPLSGGRDSRHLLLELCHQGARPREAVTWGPFVGGGGREAHAAAGVANALGIPHTRLAPRRSFSAYEFEKNLDTGFCAPDHFLFVPLREYMVGRSDHLFDGIAGDVLSQDSFMTLERRRMFAEGRFRELTLDHFASLGMREDAIRWLVGDEVYRQMPLEASIAQVVRSFEPFRDQPRGYTLWTFYTRTTRMVGLAPFHMYRAIPVVDAPYLDREVFDFMTSIPAEIVQSGNFHDDAIARAFPRFGHLPFAPSPSPSIKYRLSLPRQLATLRDLFTMAGTRLPRRLPSLARWAAFPVWPGPCANVPRKWVTYWLQLEALMSAELHAHAMESRRPDELLPGSQPHDSPRSGPDRRPTANAA